MVDEDGVVGGESHLGEFVKKLVMVAMNARMTSFYCGALLRLIRPVFLSMEQGLIDSFFIDWMMLWMIMPLRAFLLPVDLTRWVFHTLLGSRRWTSYTTLFFIPI